MPLYSVKNYIGRDLEVLLSHLLHSNRIGLFIISPFLQGAQGMGHHSPNLFFTTALLGRLFQETVFSPTGN